MNQVLQCIEDRYSCRAFDGRMPQDDQLQAIAEAVLRSPSAMNRQPWRAILVTDTGFIAQMEEEALRALKALEDQSAYQRIMSRGGTLFYGAPAMLVLPAMDQGGLLDVGIACQSGVLAAQSMGINTLICGMARFAFMGENAPAFHARLGIPQGYVFGTTVLLGYEKAPGSPHSLDREKLTWVR